MAEGQLQKRPTPTTPWINCETTKKLHIVFAKQENRGQHFSYLHQVEVLFPSKVYHGFGLLVVDAQGLLTDHVLPVVQHQHRQVVVSRVVTPDVNHLC